MSLQFKIFLSARPGLRNAGRLVGREGDFGCSACAVDPAKIHISGRFEYDRLEIGRSTGQADIVGIVFT